MKSKTGDQRIIPGRIVSEAKGFSPEKADPRLPPIKEKIEKYVRRCTHGENGLRGRRDDVISLILCLR